MKSIYTMCFHCMPSIPCDSLPTVEMTVFIFEPTCWVMSRPWAVTETIFIELSSSAPRTAALKSMIRITPDHVNAWYELGLLEAQADNLRAAITALETFLSKSAHDAARHHAATLIQELHAKLN